MKDGQMDEKWVGATVDSKVVRWVDETVATKVVGMDGQMDASMVEYLAVHWADSTVEKMALLPDVRMVVHWVDRLVDVKDERWGDLKDALMVAS